MKSRSRLAIAALLVAALLGGFVLWYTANTQQFRRLVDDLEHQGGVTSVEVSGTTVVGVHLTSSLTDDEAEAVARLLDDADADLAPADLRISIDGVSTDLYDFPDAWRSMAAVAEVPRARHVEAREIAEGEVWVETILGDAEDNGGLEPRPATGAAIILPMLESVQANGVPEELVVLAAHRENNDFGLVLIEDSALEDLDATMAALRSAAERDPDRTIVCDRAGCHLGR